MYKNSDMGRYYTALTLLMISSKKVTKDMLLSFEYFAVENSLNFLTWDRYKAVNEFQRIFS